MLNEDSEGLWGENLNNCLLRELEGSYVYMDTAVPVILVPYVWRQAEQDP